MEQENIQPQINEQKKQKMAKWALRILLFIIFILLGLTIYKTFYVDAFGYYNKNFFSRLISFKRDEIFMFLALLIVLYLYFLPYYISNHLYKKSKYLKQIIWGIVTLVLTQLLVAIIIAIFTHCMGCYNREWINEHKNDHEDIPCIPSPYVICK